MLIIDDLFGRTLPDKKNMERENLCGQFLLEDISQDELGKGTPQRIKKPIAQVVFYRGQNPACAKVGDSIENDLEGTISFIEAGWKKPPYWSLVLLDLCFYTGKVTETSNGRCKGMPEGRTGDDDPKQYFGLKILATLRETMPDIPVVILSSKPEEGITLDYTKLGALGFIARAETSGPNQLEEHLYNNALILDDTKTILGQSKSLLTVLRAVRRSNVTKNIMFRGEMGTGKGLFASYAHNLRQNFSSETVPYKIVNCPQIASELFAGELFGHAKGSFTSANSDKAGIVEEANNGDVFLDEIAELPPPVQAGIRKVIEERTFSRVGESRIRHADVRFLSATNSSLVGFQEDLLMRLTEAGTITLPPLRDRKDDIPILTERFVRLFEKTCDARERTIEPDTLEMLKRYPWPGNVRELEHVIQRAIQHYSKLPHLIPEHIVFNDYNIDLVAPANNGNKVVIGENIASDDRRQFIDYKLPEILKDQNIKTIKYIMLALESNSDRRNDEPNYPKTWHAMTGENIKSTMCQRNIGDFIFQLEEDELIPLMLKSTVFRKSVLQCGDKIKGVRMKLSALIEKIFLEFEDEKLIPLILSTEIKKILKKVVSENISEEHHLQKRLDELETKLNNI